MRDAMRRAYASGIGGRMRTAKHGRTDVRTDGEASTRRTQTADPNAHTRVPTIDPNDGIGDAP